MKLWIDALTTTTTYWEVQIWYHSPLRGAYVDLSDRERDVRFVWNGLRR